MTSDTLKLYLTPEHKCSYLPDQETKSLFLDPKIEVSSGLYSQLNQMGFRRSGMYVYKPHCDNCNACRSCRVLAFDFAPSRSQKRIAKRNQHLNVENLSWAQVHAAYPLYERYINERHADGDMYPANTQQFESFLLEVLESTEFVGFYDDEKLICVSVIDIVDDGLSALYTFFDPDYQRNALGVNAILWQIDECKRRGLPYVYLGYWIDDCKKMAYKSAYQPLQIRRENHWLKLPEDKSE